jgi:xanthine dehydrogenase iron-sulfur cluster and FAD-binding subunit A
MATTAIPATASGGQIGRSLPRLEAREKVIKQLLDAYPDPDDGRIRDYLAGNLCRCAAYPEIIQAVKAAARKRQAVRSG